MFTINSDIRKAHTPPARFYRQSDYFEASLERIFQQSWHYLADANLLPEGPSYYPITLLPETLQEPLLLTRGRDQQLRCLSNVCTHRGKVIAEQPGKGPLLRCGYHGRCFDIQGKFRSMPGFEEVPDFPSPSDHLHQLPLEEHFGMLFSSIRPRVALKTMIQPILDRLSWLPLDQLVFTEAGTRDFQVQAHWALYCDNSLEGFHIPFVHPALNAAVEMTAYETEQFDYCNLQLGLAKENEPCFDQPDDAPDAGRRIYAYYFWVFPNLMFNFYPWGLSLNLVDPISPNLTRVRFRTYRFPEQPFNREENQLEVTELEDEAVVESVQQGLQGSFYDRGRYSPTWEQNLHHFHRLLADWLFPKEN
jgi:choline monooxygenase